MRSETQSHLFGYQIPDLTIDPDYLQSNDFTNFKF
jgi:hypothetical protein